MKNRLEHEQKPHWSDLPRQPLLHKVRRDSVTWKLHYNGECYALYISLATHHLLQGLH